MPHIFISLAILAGLDPAASGAAGAVEADIRQQCEDGSFSGYVLAVRDDERIIDFGCAPADLEQPRSGTLFKLFSTSKMFTAAVIVSLAEGGLIELDAPLGRYVDPLPVDWQDITARQLLNHNSGIPDLTGELLAEYTRHGALSHADAMRSLLRRTGEEGGAPLSDPGGAFAYNNFGYELLVELARQVTERDFVELVQERVFGPAGMSGARLDVPLIDNGEVTGSQPVPGLIEGYNGEPGALNPAVSYSFVQQGAGAVFASAEDLLAYSRALNEGRVVSADAQARSIDEALRVNEAVRYGFGEMVREAHGCTVLQHSGGNNGYSIDYARVPERNITVAVLSNFGFAGAHAVRVSLVEALTAEEPCREVD